MTPIVLAPLYSGEDALQVAYGLAQAWATRLAVEVALVEDLPAGFSHPDQDAPPGERLRVLTTRRSLFDGPGHAAQGSAVEVAIELGAPLVLVLDVSGTARSAAALALGCRIFEPRLHLAGVICTHCGSERHTRALQAAMDEITLPLFGCLPRHGGLRPPDAAADTFLASPSIPGVARVQEYLDLDGLLAVAREGAPPELAEGSPPELAEETTSMQASD